MLDTTLNTVANLGGVAAIVGAAVWWLVVGRRRRPTCHVVAEAEAAGPARVPLAKLSLGRRTRETTPKACGHPVSAERP